MAVDDRDRLGLIALVVCAERVGRRGLIREHGYPVRDQRKRRYEEVLAQSLFGAIVAALDEVEGVGSHRVVDRAAREIEVEQQGFGEERRVGPDEARAGAARIGIEKQAVNPVRLFRPVDRVASFEGVVAKVPLVV